MKLSRFVAAFVVTLVAFSISATSVLAQTFAQTLVVGTVYDSTHHAVSGGSVNVQCGTGNQSASIAADGTYQVLFQQTECKAGDTASVTASTSAGSGSNATTVQNTTVNGPVVDLDVAVVDVNINVPEFGILGGLVSMIGAAGSYIYMKSRSLV